MMWYAVVFVAALAVGCGLTLLVMRIVEKRSVARSRSEAQRILELAEREAERIRVEGELAAKKLVESKQSEFERELRERRKEIGRLEKRLASREASLDRKYEALERKEGELSRKLAQIENRRKELDAKEAEFDSLIEQAKEKIEQIAGMTQEEAKQELINMIEDEARMQAAKRIKMIEEELHETAERKAKEIIALAIQRYAGEYSSEKTISVVALPSDDMKGRIIGREGRNIRSLESRTGVDIIIDDTPETVVLSSLNPIRRKVARIALERLIADGRIHPARIEEVVAQVEKEIDKEIQKAGEEAVFDIGANDMHPELVKLVGKLKYRSSYSQNVLNHSLEVAFIAGVIASQLGVNAKLAKRAGLLHDIGKAVDHEVEGSHVEIGAELVRRYGESPEVCEAVANNHDPNPNSILSVIVQAADAISAARPGARREMYESYVQRITELERIAGSFRGVDKCYAVHAGREVRVIVESSKVNDEEAALLSTEIAKKIEREVAYPGQVKITVIREVRSSAYAT